MSSTNRRKISIDLVGSPISTLHTSKNLKVFYEQRDRHQVHGRFSQRPSHATARFDQNAKIADLLKEVSFIFETLGAGIYDLIHGDLGKPAILPLPINFPEPH